MINVKYNNNKYIIKIRLLNIIFITTTRCINSIGLFLTPLLDRFHPISPKVGNISNWK